MTGRTDLLMLTVQIDLLILTRQEGLTPKVQTGLLTLTGEKSLPLLTEQE